jgi:hypothetical protein
MKVINISAELMEELRRENCCRRIEELKKLLEESVDFALLIYYYENLKCCKGEK